MCNLWSSDHREHRTAHRLNESDTAVATHLKLKLVISWWKVCYLCSNSWGACGEQKQRVALRRRKSKGALLSLHNWHVTVFFVFFYSEEVGSKTPQPEDEINDEFDISSIELAIRNESIEVKNENKQLHNALNSLQDKYTNVSSEVSIYCLKIKNKSHVF